MCNEVIRKEWVKVEHDLRFLGDNTETTKLDNNIIYTIDSLKSGIIALCGFKLFGDNNEIFYENTKHILQKDIKELESKIPTEKTKLENIQKFVLDNF